MTTNRLPVLRSRIPVGGRALSPIEVSILRMLGVRVPRGCWVMRAHDADHIGALYKPYAGGMADHGVSVVMRGEG